MSPLLLFELGDGAVDNLFQRHDQTEEESGSEHVLIIGRHRFARSACSDPPMICPRPPAGPCSDLSRTPANPPLFANEIGPCRTFSILLMPELFSIITNFLISTNSFVLTGDFSCPIICT
jgi:hypothetical protein